MSLTPAQVKTQIITGGISCLPACSGGLINSWIFNLAGCVEVIVSPMVGGAYPLAPGEVAKLYQPVDPSDTPPFYVRPGEKDIFTDRHHVLIRVKFNGKVTEKEFIVSPRRAQTIVRVANFVNRTQERIQVMAKNFRKITNRVVNVTNFRKKR